MKKGDLLKNIKQAILQQAIQGKLTEDWRKQNPDVEPASELLKRIKAEKEKLIKEKKIRKEKPLPPITQDEIPFELPDGWVWCRLGEIGITQTGTTPPKNDSTYYGDYISFIQPSNITDNGLNFDCIYLSEKGINKSRFIPKFSNLMVCIGGSAGKTCFNEIDVTCNQQINTITGLEGVEYKFLDIVLKSPYFYNEVWDTIKQGSTPILNKGNWSKIIIPLCSTAEQKVIVEKVEKLMQNVSAMEEEIQKSEQNAEMLMQAVLKEAFEDKKKILKYDI
jgi:type I restriction enzyme S subunit